MYDFFSLSSKKFLATIVILFLDFCFLNKVEILEMAGAHIVQNSPVEMHRDFFTWSNVFGENIAQNHSLFFLNTYIKISLRKTFLVKLFQVKNL